MMSFRKSLSWCLLLLVLLIVQQESDAGVSLKLKKLLKKALLIRALSPKKSIAILPIPIPLELLKKELGKLLPKMPEMKMPEMMMQMPPHAYPPMYMASGNGKMMGHEMMMPKDTMMIPHYITGMKFPSPNYEMMSAS